jgi:hypothetical protein
LPIKVAFWYGQKVIGTERVVTLVNPFLKACPPFLNSPFYRAFSILKLYRGVSIRRTSKSYRSYRVTLIYFDLYKCFREITKPLIKCKNIRMLITHFCTIKYCISTFARTCMLSCNKQCAAIDSYAKVGTHTVFLSLHFANPPILGVIPLSQIGKFLGVPKYNFFDLFTILHISQVCQSANRKSANCSLRDREDKQLFFKVWLLFVSFEANPPTIRPQVYSAVFL